MFERIKAWFRQRRPDYVVTTGPAGENLLRSNLVLADGHKIELFFREYPSVEAVGWAGGRVYAFLRRQHDFKTEAEIEVFRRKHGGRFYWAFWAWPEGMTASRPVGLELPA